jgi:hypothetical protein
MTHIEPDERLAKLEAIIEGQGKLLGIFEEHNAKLEEKLDENRALLAQCVERLALESHKVWVLQRSEHFASKKQVKAEIDDLKLKQNELVKMIMGLNTLVSKTIGVGSALRLALHPKELAANYFARGEKHLGIGTIGDPKT